MSTGIDLGWIPTTNKRPNIAVHVESGRRERISDGDRVAIKVKFGDDGKYLKYGVRDYGINLIWSESPEYEWELRTTLQGGSGQHVKVTQNIGLYNVKVSDFLFYDPRQHGIDLKWLRDEGKFNGHHWWESVEHFVEGVVSTVVNLVKDVLWGYIGFLVGIFDTLLSLLWMPPKKMRVSVVILRDAEGRALLGDEEAVNPADEIGRVQQAVDYLKDVFWDHAKVRIIVVDRSGNEEVNGKPVPVASVLRGPAPASTLQMPCGTDAFPDNFKESGDFFRQNAARTSEAIFTGYRQPVTAFIIQEILGSDIGCTQPFSNYTLLETKAFDVATDNPVDTRPSTLAHELGHSTWLTDRYKKKYRANVMYKYAHKSGYYRGTNITRWQAVTMRASRYVTYL